MKQAKNGKKNFRGCERSQGKVIRKRGRIGMKKKKKRKYIFDVFRLVSETKREPDKKKAEKR